MDEAQYLDKLWADVLQRNKRRERASLGWFNWHVNRKRISLSATGKELRMISWRRAL